MSSHPIYCGVDFAKEQFDYHTAELRGSLPNTPTGHRRLSDRRADPLRLWPGRRTRGRRGPAGGADGAPGASAPAPTYFCVSFAITSCLVFVLISVCFTGNTLLLAQRPVHTNVSLRLG